MHVPPDPFDLLGLERDRLKHRLAKAMAARPMQRPKRVVIRLKVPKKQAGMKLLAAMALPVAMKQPAVMKVARKAVQPTARLSNWTIWW